MFRRVFFVILKRAYAIFLIFNIPNAVVFALVLMDKGNVTDLQGNKILDVWIAMFISRLCWFSLCAIPGAALYAAFMLRKSKS